MNDSPIGLNIIKIFDTIGFLGPFILLTIGIWQLWGNHGFWCAYLVVTIVNSFVNKIVKSIVKQPRPFDGESIMDEGYNGCEMYGMPSGHSQSVFSSLTFLYLVMENEKKSKKNSKVNLGGSYKFKIAAKYKKPKTRGDKNYNKIQRDYE